VQPDEPLPFPDNPRSTGPPCIETKNESEGNVRDVHHADFIPSYLLVTDLWSDDSCRRRCAQERPLAYTTPAASPAWGACFVLGLEIRSRRTIRAFTAARSSGTALEARWDSSASNSNPAPRRRSSALRQPPVS